MNVKCNLKITFLQHKCSQCQCVYYCGRSCQKFDWGMHRVVCASFNKIPANHLSAKSILVYYFPEDKKAAELAWVSLSFFLSQ